MRSEHVILVDSSDREIGTEEKLSAHRRGVLHRAFSAFVVHPDGRMLLQRRALRKYHSAGLWSNTCCSHPRPGETVIEAAQRRMVEEMGVSVDLEPAFSFTYRADLEHNLIEHEFDHVLIGRSSAPPRPAEQEVADWRWVTVADIRDQLMRSPEDFTIWFRLVFDRVVDVLEADGGKAA